MLLRLAWAALVVAVAVAPAASASAQADVPPEAVEFYRQAREYYEAGEYRQAATALERALVLDPDSPTLVYNLARVYELLGQLDDALAQYARYQELLPQQQAQEQERAETTIRRLQGAMRSQDTTEPEPPPREVEPLRQLPGVVLVRENGVADEAFWLTLAAGVAGLALGATFGGLALSERSNANNFRLDGTNDPSQRLGSLDRAHAYGLVADISLGVGGAAVLVAGLLYFLRVHTVERAPVGAAPERSGEASLTPLVGPGLLGAAARVAF